MRETNRTLKLLYYIMGAAGPPVRTHGKFWPFWACASIAFTVWGGNIGNDGTNFINTTAMSSRDAEMSRCM